MVWKVQYYYLIKIESNKILKMLREVRETLEKYCRSWGDDPEKFLESQKTLEKIFKRI